MWQVQKKIMEIMWKFAIITARRMFSICYKCTRNNALYIVSML